MPIFSASIVLIPAVSVACHWDMSAPFTENTAMDAGPLWLVSTCSGLVDLKPCVGDVKGSQTPFCIEVKPLGFSTVNTLYQ